VVLKPKLLEEVQPLKLKLSQLLQVIVRHQFAIREVIIVALIIHLVIIVSSSFSRCHLVDYRRPDYCEILIVMFRLGRSLELAKLEVETDLGLGVVIGVTEEASDFEVEQALEGLQGVVPGGKLHLLVPIL